MTLEQRLAAVEAELEKMKTQQKDNKDIAELMKKTITEAIKKERRPGGLLYRSERRENAAISQAAIDSNVSAIIENAEANDGVITTKKSDGTISLRLTQTW
ncbi:TPA: hypothetical protein ACSA7L_004107 [Yersinia enterocolitica]|uniref:hypothetical protein n=1 Tax=Yersinia enterocolitica TaxID=630 RepID=UPI0005DDBEB7|nr:hypothetical protein [Yersinia enterocolitica]EKN3588953.1 hypothetical protein [Yersinia enterocolitica]EKN4904668.1 hypothetical protein [Yersinia enterocolitica]EKN5141711.1 hypothetical protein [Yersinia enterocolitica]EKN6170545.1 hypothetical protein [Yersinia enterocolitica]EKN6276293.1 hypothetical protein [Yersinia enterocolitica]